MKTYLFNASVENHASGKIFTAENGEGYIEGNALHIKESKYHFVYKFDGEPVGWYMRNESSGEDVYLGDRASPSAEYDDLMFGDETYFNSITHSMDDQNEEVE